MFYTHEQQLYQHGAQRPMEVSGFFLTPAPFTGMTSNFPLSSIPQQSQQDSNAFPPHGMMLAPDENRNSNGYNAAPLQTVAPDISSLIWTSPRSDSIGVSAMSSMDSNNTMSFSPSSVKYVFPFSDVNAGRQGNTNNQAYLRQVAVNQDESRSTVMVLPSQGSDVSVAANPFYVVLANAPGDFGGVHLQRGKLLPGESSLHNAFIPSMSTSTNSTNQLQQLFPYSVYAGAQPQCNQESLKLPWNSKLGSNMATPSANKYHTSSKTSTSAPVEETLSMLHSQQQGQYTNTHAKIPMTPAFFPSNCPRQCGMNAYVTGTNGGNLHFHGRELTAGCGGEQKKERRGGLPFIDDPIPIDVTKTQLIVNFIPQFLTDDGFRELFTPFGAIHKKPTKIIYDREARRGKGYGFVYYKDGRSTEAAIKTLNGFLLGGRMLKVRYADQQRTSVDCDSCVGDNNNSYDDNDDDDKKAQNNYCDASISNQESLLNAVIMQ